MMQREDVEQLATELDRQDEYAPLGHVGWEAAVALRALLAQRDALRAAIFGGTDYATDLTNGNFVEMAQTTEAARIGALARAEKAEAERDALQGQLNDLRNGWANSVKAHAALLAERDAAFAAGQESMRERAAKKCQWHSDRLVETIRALPIKPRP